MRVRVCVHVRVLSAEAGRDLLFAIKKMSSRSIYVSSSTRGCRTFT